MAHKHAVGPDVENAVKQKQMKLKTMNTKISLSIVWVIAALSLSACAQDSLSASDDAGNYSSWGMGNSSGNQASAGIGLGPWSFINSTPDGGYAGEYLGTSIGQDPTAPYNINSGNGDAWGFYANSAAFTTSQAIAPFTGSLGVYQTFDIAMQNYFVGTGTTNGFNLQNSSGGNLFSFYFVGGQSDYYIDVGGTQYGTGLGFTTNGLTLAFTQGTGDNWSFKISGPTVATITLTSGSTGMLANNNISQVDMFNATGSGGGGLQYNTYFNNIQIVPEPWTLTLMGLAGMALVVLRRRT